MTVKTNELKAQLLVLTYRILLVTIISLTLDLFLSTAEGYRLRVDVGILVALDALFLFLIVGVVLCTLFIISLARRFKTMSDKSQWSYNMFIAWLPIGFVLVWRFHNLLAMLLQTGVLILLLTGCILESRKISSKVNWISHLTTYALAVITIWLVISISQVGRSMLRDGFEPNNSSAIARSPNLLLIVLDTVRSDHLEAYGYSRPTSPWLKRIAEKATVFDYAFAPSSYTLPSHATLFTGLYPRAHGADVVDDDRGVSLQQLGRLDDWVRVSPLSPDAITLAEIARDAGIETGAICANTAYLYRYFGLDQGFNTYVDARPIREIWRPAGLTIGDWVLNMLDKNWRYQRLLESNERYYLLASEVNALAVEWLKTRRNTRFFLFLNYMDAHQPYLPVGKYKRLFPSSDTDRLNAYDAEIRYLDDNLSKLFGQLRTWDLLDNTLIVIVGDHGESFGEHEKWGHARTVYEPEVRIPLILELPAQQIGHRIDRFVHLVDTFPTILDLMGLERPSNLQGDSLFKERRSCPIVSFLGKYQRDYEEWAIYQDPLKLIVRSENADELAIFELYNIRENPEESEDLAVRHPRLVAKMTSELESFQKEVQLRFKRTEKPKLDVETLKRLRSLGYIR